MNATQKRIASLVNNLDDFRKLVDSGMFWEWFPESDGTYLHFIKLYKQQETTQDGS